MLLHSLSWHTSYQRSVAGTRRLGLQGTLAQSHRRWMRAGLWIINDSMWLNILTALSYPRFTAFTPSNTFSSLNVFMWRCMLGKCFLMAFSLYVQGTVPNFRAGFRLWGFDSYVEVCYLWNILLRDFQIVCSPVDHPALWTGPTLPW